MKQTNFSSLFKLLLGWPLGLLALYFIWRIVGTQWPSLLSSLFHVRIWLLLYGIGSIVLYFFLRSYLWYRLVQPQITKLSLRESSYYWAVAELKRYVPGTVWAVTSRIVHFSDKGLGKKDVGKAYLLEAIYIVLGSAYIALFGVGLLIQRVISIHFLPVYCVSIVLISLVIYVGIPFKKTAEKILLLSLAVSAFFFFGLGSYLIIIALVNLPLQLIYVFIGFFTLTYVLGYVSFIIPSGIGIREGLIMWGLQPFLNVSVAGFAALFSRVILIFAELVFLFFVILWHKTHVFFSVERYIRKYPYAVALVFFMIVYTVYFTTASFARYDNFYTGRFDLGNMDQTVWNTSHGRIFQLTDPNGTYDVSRLATHADFLLILLAPFYWIWSDPRVLLLIQTIVLALGAIYVYLLSKKICRNQPIALVFSFMYLLNPSVQRTNIYDFHAVTLATTFLLAAFYYMSEKRYRLFLLYAVFAGLTKEQVWLMVSFFGVYIGLIQKKVVLGVTLFIFGTLFSYYLISYAIPHALGSQHFALSYYTDFGDTPLTVIKNVLIEPGKVIALAFGPKQLYFLQQIVSSVGYLAICSPLYMLFASAELAISLLSSNPNLHQIYYQYTATITPFLFISAIYGVARIRRFLPLLPTYSLVLYIIALSLATAYLYGPLPGAVEANTDMFTKPLTDSSAIDRFLQSIPKRYSVAASNNLGSHLSHRQNIYTIPVGVDKADVIAFLLTDPNAQPSLAFHKNLVAKLRKDPKYVIWYEDGPFIVFRRKILPSTIVHRQEIQ